VLAISILVSLDIVLLADMSIYICLYRNGGDEAYKGQHLLVA